MSVQQQRVNSISAREREAAHFGAMADAAQNIEEYLKLFPTRTNQQAEIIQDLARACRDARVEYQKKAAMAIERASTVRRTIGGAS